MKKLLFMAFALCCFSMSANAQLLYKVSGEKLAKPSYIVGTFRLVNPQGVVQQIAGIKNAMIETDQMYFELAPDSTSFIKAERNLPEGKTLKNVLTPVQYKKLDTFLKKYEGVGLASPHAQKRYGHLTPLALKGELEKLLFVAHHMGEYDPTHSFDQYFQAQAKVNKEPMYGLTSTEKQVAHLKQLPMERQTAILMNLIDHEDAVMQQLDNIVNGFNSQDVEAVAKAAKNSAEVDAIVAGWVKQMPTIMQKPTLFVVDAAKMGGAKGILASLKAEGLTVEGVK